MSDPQETMTAFVTSDVLDRDSLQTFLTAQKNGGNVRWRGMCWEIREHKEHGDTTGQHSFRLASVPGEDCR